MIRISFLLYITIFFCAACYAEEIEINVHTESAPKAALGIFFASGKIVQQPETSFERINENTVVVKLPYSIENLPSALPFVTAYVLTEDNQIVFGDVRLASAADEGQSILRMPECSKDSYKPSAQMLLSEQVNYLESLLEVRLKKREIAQRALNNKITPEMAARLQKWESRFGLKYEYPISAERSGLELVERLTRLKDTIMLFRSSKNTEKSNLTPPPAKE